MTLILAAGAIISVLPSLCFGVHFSFPAIDAFQQLQTKLTTNPFVAPRLSYSVSKIVFLTCLRSNSICLL